MAGIQDFVIFEEDFLGPQTMLTAPVGSDQWDVVVTTTAGTPTYTVGGVNGELSIDLDTNDESEIVTVYQSDILNYDIDLLDHIEFRVKMAQAAVGATTELAFGMTSARNDVIDTIAEAALFRVVGADSTTAVVVETDDGSAGNAKDDIATGVTLINAYKKFVISFSHGTSDVRFYIDGVRVAASTTFDMSTYTAGLQPMIQLQKPSGLAGDGVVVDYLRIVSRRA